MAGVLISCAGRYNVPIANFRVETRADVDLLPTTKEQGKADWCKVTALPPIGSECFIIDEREVVYLTSQGWV